MASVSKSDVLWLAGVTDCAKSVGVQPIRLTAKPNKHGIRKTYEGNRPQLVYRTSNEAVRGRIKRVLHAADIRCTERAVEHAIQVMSQVDALALAKLLRPHAAVTEPLDEIIEFVTERQKVRKPRRRPE
jgi:hypothetical protein